MIKKLNYNDTLDETKCQNKNIFIELVLNIGWCMKSKIIYLGNCRFSLLIIPNAVVIEKHLIKVLICKE